MVFDHHMKLRCLVQGDALEVPLKALEEKQKKKHLNLQLSRTDCVSFTLMPPGHRAEVWYVKEISEC